MSDLESVDLSQESDAEVSEDMSPLGRAQPTPPVSHPKKKTPTSVPQRTQPDKGTAPAKTDEQNGIMTPERRLKTRVEAPAPRARSATTTRPASQAPGTASQKSTERPLEKPVEQPAEPPKTAPVKAKRGRPRKVRQLQRVEEHAAVTEPQSASRSAPGTKPTTTSKSPAASKPTAASKSTAGPKSTAASKPTSVPKPTSSPRSAAAPKPAAVSKSTPAPKATTTPRQTASAKPADAEAPRTGGRGRKRRLATKPVEPTQAEDKQDKATGAGVSNSQQSKAPEQVAPPQKPTAKPGERKLYGAAKTAVMNLKRKREEEARTAVVPVSRPSRGKKKDSDGFTPEVAEVSRSPTQKGRATKRVRRLPPKEAPRAVPQEVIRIEDDDVSSDELLTPVATVKAASQAQRKASTSQENAALAPAPTGNAAPTRSRQSLPSSFARPAGRRSKVRDEAFGASANRQPDGPSDDLLRTGGEDPLPERAQDVRIQTQNELSRPASNIRTRRTHAVRHSTGNIVPMEMEDMPEPDPREDRVRFSKDEAVKSLLDEIQRNAIPFLFTQDRICDSFSTRIGEDADVILKNSDNDVFETFTDRVKDALVADRLRLAVASAKTDLRRGMEKLLREFARKVGAPLTEADSSLLLRNEAFRKHSRVKEERRVSKHPGLPSPRNPRLSTLVTQRRVAEDSNYHEEASDGDDLSDAGDPIITTPRRPPRKKDIPSIMNVADLRKFVGYSYENLNLGCDRSRAILKLCAQPGGMTFERIHGVTPLGRVMIRNKAKDLIERGYLVEDVIREGDKDVSVYSTAVHVSDS